MTTHAPETALVSTATKDEAETQLWFPTGKENFADDKKAREWIEENLIPLVLDAESMGVQQRDEWNAIKDMLYLKHSTDRGYKGESDIFLPIYAKASDTRTSHMSRALFPTDQVVDVVLEDDETTPGDEETVKAWMQYQIEKEAKLRLNMKKFLRQLNDYGFSVAKVYWHKPQTPDKQVSLEKVLSAGTYGNLSAANCEGARFLTRDIFGFYMWPTTVDDGSQASLMFEVMAISKQDADLRFKNGTWKNQQDAGFPDTAAQYEQDLQINTDLVTGEGTTPVNSATHGELGTWGYVKECWFRMPVPAALYGPGETPGTPVPVKVVLVNGVPVEATRNPFWHQKPPYVTHALNQRPASAYGIGLGRMGLEIQTLINDTANQTQDNVTYGLNPMLIVNPNQLVGNSNVVIKPGGVVNTLDPASVKWDRPPVEQMQYGNQQVNTFVAFMNDLLGTPPIIQGSGAKGSAKTATGSQILQNNVKSDMQDVIEDVELAVLIPTMEMVYMLGQQYEKDDRWIAVAGAPPVRFTREAFLGKFRFRWLASSQTANQQVRAQQAMMFMQMLPGVIPLLQVQGKMVNPEPLMKLIYATLIGGRDFDKIVVPMPMPPTMPGAAPGAAPPGVPGAPGEGGDRARSAVEQAPGGSGEVAPGEAEDFMNVRAGADEMAGAMGGFGGFGGEDE